MKTHRCKLPNSTTYRAGMVFTCSSCGRTYVLTASWVEKPNLRHVAPEAKVKPEPKSRPRVFRSMTEVDAAFFPNVVKDVKQERLRRHRRRPSDGPTP